MWAELLDALAGHVWQLHCVVANACSAHAYIVRVNGLRTGAWQQLISLKLHAGQLSIVCTAGASGTLCVISLMCSFRTPSLPLTKL